MECSLLSIIVPAYNVEGYIEKTIESICRQTYQNIEIIIVDDGSTDGTREVINSLLGKDDRIKAFFKQNEGVTKARLYGVERANGEWIGFVDADDLISETMYETLLSNARVYKADVSHCGYKMVFPDKEILYYGTGRLVEQDAKQGLVDLLEGAFIEPTLCNKLFNRKLFEGLAQKMDPSITHLEDLLMNFYLFQQAQKSVYYDECLYQYVLRKNSAATSQLSLKKVSGPLKVFRTIQEECRSDETLERVLDNRIVGNLLQVVLIAKKRVSKDVWAYCVQARKELRSMRRKIRSGKFPKKVKILSFLAVNANLVYRLIYFLHAKITRSDKKYKV